MRRWVKRGEVPTVKIGNTLRVDMARLHGTDRATERYAHLRPEHFKEEDFDALRVDLSHSGGDVVSIGRSGSENGAGGYAVVTRVENGGERIQITA